MASVYSKTSESLGALNAATTTTHASSSGFGGLPGVAIQVTGTFTGTLTFQGSVDGATWVAIGAVPAAGGAEVSTTAATGLWMITRVPPFVRVQMTAFTSGSAVVAVATIG